ncbi:GNAT family N-acetyltransferase [Umezawaea tangerina]|uniref:N-acetyltransferase domain-containing protein n=1 Tax=Umezawaea tangerina TaxID=84725 RepID=A0A2T0T499_9PSEU|nr:GNAT family N-acetyltransferase [Umezawaea tangerina]PRY40492.1 hypothetical protein CLV43_106228 [Umezawaea tangerina]
MTAVDVVASSYLDAAAAADALHGTAGSCWVGGEYADPSNDHVSYLVQYCSPGLVRDAVFTRELLHVLSTEAPKARDVLLRLPAGVSPGDAWRTRTTYVRHDGSPSTPDTAGFTVDHARVDDEGAVLGWLTDAIAEGASSWGMPGRTDAQEKAARLVLDAPGRVTFVARDENGPVGHATILTEEWDEVVGEAFVELFDVLVVPGHRRHRQAVRLLSGRAVDHARERGLPLIGNVVHPSGVDGPGHAERILASLARGGWRPDHVLWSCDVDRLAGSGS